MRLPVNASIALHTVNKYRRRARLALPEPPAGSMPSAPGTPLTGSENQWLSPSSAQGLWGSNGASVKRGQDASGKIVVALTR